MPAVHADVSSSGDGQSFWGGLPVKQSKVYKYINYESLFLAVSRQLYRPPLVTQSLIDTFEKTLPKSTLRDLWTLRQFSMTIFYDNFLMIIFDDNFWWSFLRTISMKIFDEIFCRHFLITFLMTIFDDHFWRQFLLTIFDDNFWW